MRHEAISIPLDRDHIFSEGEKKVQYIAPKSSKILKWLREFMKKDLADLKHCPNCGGILPELMFIFEGKEYWFTCFKIKENGKPIPKNYEGQAMKK